MAAGRRRHPFQALTAVSVRQIKKPGRHADGGGLYLLVEPTGAKRWLLRTVVRGRRRDIGLGSARLVSLAEAREKAVAYRKSAREGGDPVVDRRKANMLAPTFEEMARLVHAAHSPSWRNPKHAAQWIGTLAEYVFPFIGSRPIDQIEPAEVLRALAPLWLVKQETARRVRQRIKAVFDFGKGAGHRTGDNPVDGLTRVLPRQNDRAQHHVALPYRDVPAFLQQLATSSVSEVAKLAFEFLILTASRTNEVLGACWKEIDFERAIWTVPAARMKAKIEHRVPLTPRATAILERARTLSGDSEFIFPGRSRSRPLSNMVFLQALRRMDVRATAHGFRSSFRDWSAEVTNFPREVCEMALAHTIKSKTEAAYRRGDLIEKRRELMLAWSDYISSWVASDRRVL